MRVPVGEVVEAVSAARLRLPPGVGHAPDARLVMRWVAVEVLGGRMAWPVNGPRLRSAYEVAVGAPSASQVVVGAAMELAGRCGGDERDAFAFLASECSRYVCVAPGRFRPCNWDGAAARFVEWGSRQDRVFELGGELKNLEAR